MPLLPGSSGAVLWDYADDQGRVALAAAHGHTLARLHEATFAARSRTSPSEIASCRRDYRTWTMERIGSCEGCVAQSMRSRSRMSGSSTGWSSRAPPRWTNRSTRSSSTMTSRSPIRRTRTPIAAPAPPACSTSVRPTSGTGTRISSGSCSVARANNDRPSSRLTDGPPGRRRRRSGGHLQARGCPVPVECQRTGDELVR